MLYEIATLTLKLGTLGGAVASVDAWVGDTAAKGRLLGCWTSEIGPLNQLIVLRGFDDEASLSAERRRALLAANPFNVADHLTDLTMESYAPFPFMAPVEPGVFGEVYEIRTYRPKFGGLQPTIDAWADAVPERTKLSPLVIAMYGLDGAPRFTHIWPFASLEARAAIRADAVTVGAWPPKGGPAWLTTDMRSTVALPTAISPLR
jgi:hypothetical protein